MTRTSLPLLLLLLTGCILPEGFHDTTAEDRPAPSAAGPEATTPWPSPDGGDVPPAGPDAVDAALADFGEYMNSRPDAEGVCRRIRRLGALGDPRVVPALAPLLDGKHLEVRVAAADWIGRQGDPSVAEDLVRRTKLPRVQAEPRLLAAVIGGIGDADAEGRHYHLLRLAREYAPTNAGVAAAAYRAYARVADAETVGVLVKDLNTAERDAVAGPDAAARERNGRVAAALQDLLRRLTGESLQGREFWTRWWQDHRRNWSAHGKAHHRMAPLRVEEVEGDEGGWSWERPGPDWVIAAFDDGQPRAVIALVAPVWNEAWAALSILDAKTFAMKSEAAWAVEAAVGMDRAYPGCGERFRRDRFRVSSAAFPRGKKVFLLTTVESNDLPADRREEMERIRGAFRIRR